MKALGWSTSFVMFAIVFTRNREDGIGYWEYLLGITKRMATGWPKAAPLGRNNFFGSCKADIHDCGEWHPDIFARPVGASDHRGPSRADTKASGGQNRRDVAEADSSPQ